MDALLLLGLGGFAGVLTTLTGLGGGLLLLLGLALVWDPARALACTAPALLVGNLHRLWMFRDAVDRPRLGAFALGAMPGALAGGLFAAALSPTVVQALLVATTLLTVARTLLRMSWRMPVSVLTPSGLVIGALTGTAGGAGLLASPVLWASGLAGTAYVATIAGCAVAMHAGRIVGYAMGGLFTFELLALSLLATVAILGGNLIGKRLRALVERLPENLLEQTVLVACVTLAVLGVGD